MLNSLIEVGLKRRRFSSYLISGKKCNINGIHRIKLARFVNNWPPANKAYALEGIMESWKRGFEGVFDYLK